MHFNITLFVTKVSSQPSSFAYTYNTFTHIYTNRLPALSYSWPLCFPVVLVHVYASKYTHNKNNPRSLCLLFVVRTTPMAIALYTLAHSCNQPFTQGKNHLHPYTHAHTLLLSCIGADAFFPQQRRWPQGPPPQWFEQQLQFNHHPCPLLVLAAATPLQV